MFQRTTSGSNFQQRLILAAKDGANTLKNQCFQLDFNFQIPQQTKIKFSIAY